MSTTHKIVSREDLAGIVETLKKEGKKIVTTNGTFDLLHVAHKHVLEETKALGDILVVGVNSDQSVKEYKSPLRPIIPEQDRAEMVAALECVDYVTIFGELDPRAFLDVVKPHIHAKGGEYDAEKLLETSLVRENGGEIVVISHDRKTTTSGIIERVIKSYESAQPNT